MPNVNMFKGTIAHPPNRVNCEAELPLLQLLQLPQKCQFLKSPTTPKSEANHTWGRHFQLRISLALDTRAPKPVSASTFEKRSSSTYLLLNSSLQDFYVTLAGDGECKATDLSAVNSLFCNNLGHLPQDFLKEQIHWMKQLFLTGGPERKTTSIFTSAGSNDLWSFG